MKKTIIIIVITILFFNKTNAQSPIYGLEDHTRPLFVQNAYYKDLNNTLDQFVGTWIYTDISTNTVLEIRLAKKIMNYGFGHTYEDVLYGEYSYVKNGTQIINTLNNLNTVLPNVENYNIHGNFIRENDIPVCNDCYPNQKRVELFMGDNIKHISYKFRPKVDVLPNGQTVMHALIASDGMSRYGLPSSGNWITDICTQTYRGVNIPAAYYDLIKQ